MKQSKKFFVPGNISCIFVVSPNSNPTNAGSLGIGFTFNKGVTAEVENADKTEIFWNGKSIDLPTVKLVVHNLVKEKSVRISLSSELPLGSGFGLSGAAALATAYALNKLFGLKKNRLALAKIAHTAEVKNKTGLGDVVNEYFGGFLLKTVPSSKFIVNKIPIQGLPVYCKYFSKLQTKDILSNTRRFKQINKAGKKAIVSVQEILKKYTLSSWQAKARPGSDKKDSGPSSLAGRQSGMTITVHKESTKKLFGQIIGVSKIFTEESGLLTDQRVKKTIREIELRGGHASMIMLGNAVFSDIPFEGATKLFIQ